MWNHQGLSRYGGTLSLAFAVAFVSLSIVGFDPADPPTKSVSPANTIATNPCGPVGAVIAHHLMETVGWSVWIPILGAGSVTLLVFRQRPFASWGWGI